MHEQTIMGSEEKPFIHERFEHRDAHLWRQLKPSLGLRWRHAQVWCLGVRVTDALKVIANRQHRYGLNSHRRPLGRRGLLPECHKPISCTAVRIIPRRRPGAGGFHQEASATMLFFLLGGMRLTRSFLVGALPRACLPNHWCFCRRSRPTRSVFRLLGHAPSPRERRSPTSCLP